MAAPEGSLTWPRNVPEAAGAAALGDAAVWDAASVVHNWNNKKANMKPKTFRTFI